MIEHLLIGHNHWIISNGNYCRWLMPSKLYHGTGSKSKQAIIEQGLKPNCVVKNSILSSDGVYLTSCVELAYGFAKTVAYRHRSEPVLFEIDSTQLLADKLGYDLNISFINCSQCVVYSDSIFNAKEISAPIRCSLPFRMLLEEPDKIEDPFVWDLNRPKTKELLEKITVNWLNPRY